MGWWWSSSQGAAEDEPIQSPPHNETPFSAPTPEPPISAPDIANTPRKLTRDEQTDADLAELLVQFSPETSTHTSPRAARTDGSEPTTTTTDTTPITPDSLFPTTMSCRAAFDSAFYCQSLGGQFNNVYRYGGMRDCSEKWGQFWFCMRTKSQPEERKRSMVLDHYRQRAVKYKVGPSSEDVWEVREEPVEGAFAGDLEALEREEVERGGGSVGGEEGV